MIRNGSLTVRYPTTVSATIDASNYSQMEIGGNYRVNRVAFAEHYSDALSECVYKQQSGATEYTEVRYVNNIFIETLKANNYNAQTWVDNLYINEYSLPKEKKLFTINDNFMFPNTLIKRMIFVFHLHLYINLWNSMDFMMLMIKIY